MTATAAMGHPARRVWQLWLVSVAALAVSVSADQFSWESVGVRSGISAHESDNRFIETEAYATWNLPLHPGLGKRWAFQFQLDSAAGWISGRGADAFIGSVGPALKLERETLPIALVGGINSTFMSRDSLGNKDFGIPYQLTSHVGLELHVFAHLEIGYRFQHMSNAGLGNHNPGLNLHMFGIGYAF